MKICGYCAVVGMEQTFKDFQARSSGIVQGKSKMSNSCVRFFEVGQLRQDNVRFFVCLPPHVTRSTGDCPKYFTDGYLFC